MPPSSSVAMAKYAAAAAMGMPICSKEATVPRGGPIECFLGSVHDHDEAEDESEDEQTGGFHGGVVHTFKLDR